MTINEFIERLQGVNLDWELWGGALRAQRSWDSHCVASAVLDDIHVFSNPSGGLYERLGLSMVDALTIVDSADNGPRSPIFPLSGFDPDVRKKLLKACKVTELKR